jgi:hypothetical protein
MVSLEMDGQSGGNSGGGENKVERIVESSVHVSSPRVSKTSDVYAFIALLA